MNLNFAEKPQNKRKKYKFFTKIKIKNLSFSSDKKLKSAKIRTKPDKSGQIRKSFLGTLGNFQNWNNFFDLEFSSQKIFHFLKDFHSLTPAGVPFPLEQSLILLGRIHALGHLSNNKEQVHFHSQPTTKY